MERAARDKRSSLFCLVFQWRIKTLKNSWHLDDFLLPWPEPKTEAELQKLPVREALPSVDPHNVPAAFVAGLWDPAPVPRLWAGRTVDGAPKHIEKHLEMLHRATSVAALAIFVSNNDNQLITVIVAMHNKLKILIKPTLEMKDNDLKNNPKRSTSYHSSYFHFTTWKL